MNDLTDVQWCVMDLLMRARQKGIHRLNRIELLHSKGIPQGASLKLTFAALTMPKEFVTWVGQHDFAITDAGVQFYNLRFGNGSNPQPTEVADSVIYLPGPEHYAKSGLQ
jgi:hypothetical protein